MHCSVSLRTVPVLEKGEEAGMAMTISRGLSDHAFSSQMGVLILGGLAKPTRSTTTGEAQSPGFRSAPVASSATVQTPNTTATATRTTSSGECP